MKTDHRNTHAFVREDNQGSCMVFRCHFCKKAFEVDAHTSGMSFGANPEQIRAYERRQMLEQIGEHCTGDETTQLGQ